MVNTPIPSRYTTLTFFYQQYGTKMFDVCYPFSRWSKKYRRFIPVRTFAESNAVIGWGVSSFQLLLLRRATRILRFLFIISFSGSPKIKPQFKIIEAH
jgi:hypothetical protein